MRQRVGIARALAVRPAILLMDEPLSALDSQTRELLMEDFIRLLADGSMGAVYVTHNLEEAVRLADRIVVLSRRPGRVREVVEHPADARRARRHPGAGKAARAAKRAVVADPRGGDRRRARGPACLTAPKIDAGVRRRPIKAETRPVAFRGAGFAPKAGRYAGWIALVLAIGLWQAAGSAGSSIRCSCRRPVAIVRAIWQLALSGALWQHLSYSMMRIGDGVDSRDRRRHHRRLRASGSRVWRAASASPSSRRCFRSRRSRCCRC